MAKETRFNCAYVVAEPDTRGYWGSAQTEEFYHRLCNDMIEQIKRHVDGAGSVYVENQTEDVCEHCGGHWTEDSSKYNGGCCAKDIDYGIDHNKDEPPFSTGDIVAIENNDHLGEHVVTVVEWCRPGGDEAGAYWRVHSTERREAPDLTKYPPGTIGIVMPGSHHACASAYRLVASASTPAESEAS